MWGMPSNQGGGGSGDMMTPMGDRSSHVREKCKGVLTPIGSVRSHRFSGQSQTTSVEASQKASNSRTDVVFLVST